MFEIADNPDTKGGIHKQILSLHILSKKINQLNLVPTLHIKPKKMLTIMCVYLFKALQPPFPSYTPFCIIVHKLPLPRFLL